jgi:hypothetical protein
MVNDIFSNIESIRKINEKFLADLENVQNGNIGLKLSKSEI